MKVGTPITVDYRFTMQVFPGQEAINICRACWKDGFTIRKGCQEFLELCVKWALLLWVCWLGGGIFKVLWTVIYGLKVDWNVRSLKILGIQKRNRLSLGQLHEGHDTPGTNAHTELEGLVKISHKATSQRLSVGHKKNWKSNLNESG